MIAALIVAALALGGAAAALWVAVLARGEAITCRRELARHRKAHAEAAEERRAARHHQPEPQPFDERAWPGQDPLPGLPTEQIAAQAPPTRQAPAVQLPRPGRTGGQR
jgi:hypothetical protein